MGGGKETPRQKMISMMYIVLTALLALNVSKQILDAFVAIEANIQKSALTQLGRGDEMRSELKQELAASKGEDGVDKRRKIDAALKSIALIDKEAALVIKQLDDTKLLLIEKLGEISKNEQPAPNNQEKIVWSRYSQNQPLLPTKLNLTALEAKDEFDTPMRELGIKELEDIDPNGVGMKNVWNPYKLFRKRLVELCGTYSGNEKSFKVVLNGSVDNFKDNSDLEKKAEKLIRQGNKINESEDLETLISLYCELTKLEKDKYGHDGDITENVHWLGRTFFHSPMIAAIASLSSLQYDVLAARAKALALIKGRISTGEYSFNKIEALARPSVAVVEVGDKFEVFISMAAYDTDKPLKFKDNKYPGTLKGIKDGVATLELTASGSNEMVIKGTVGIAKKDLSMKYDKFETKVFVAQKSGGSIGLPDVAVLYEDWDNKVTAKLGGSNVRITSVTCGGRPCVKKGDYYIARVAANAPTTSIVVSGKDKDDKPVSFKQTVKLRPFPKPQVINSTMSSKGGVLYVGLKGSVLEGVNFTVTEMKIGNTKVNNSVVPANALRAYGPGSVVGVKGKCKNNNNGKIISFEGQFEIQ
jgi:hypothetical protein